MIYENTRVHKQQKLLCKCQNHAAPAEECGLPLPVLPCFLILSFRREKGENGFMNRRKEACHCKNVTYGMIEDAIRNGANTLQQVMDVTSAGKGCGKCREFLEYLIRDILDAQKNA